jgi:hypothetical protein
LKPTRLVKTVGWVAKTHLIVAGRRRQLDSPYELSEHLGMGARPRKEEHLVAQGVDQHPVWRDVAVAKANQIATQCVVAIVWREGFADPEPLDHEAEEVKVLALLSQALEVAIERLRPLDGTLAARPRSCHAWRLLPARTGRQRSVLA